MVLYDFYGGESNAAEAFGLLSSAGQAGDGAADESGGFFVLPENIGF